MKRRGFFGAVAALLAAPLIPAAAEPITRATVFGWFGVPAALDPYFVDIDALIRADIAAAFEVQLDRLFLEGVSPESQGSIQREGSSMKFNVGDKVQLASDPTMRGKVGYIGDDGIRIEGFVTTFNESDLVADDDEKKKEEAPLEETAPPVVYEEAKAADYGDADVKKTE